MAYVDWIGKLDINRLIDSIINWILNFFGKIFRFLTLIPDWIKVGLFSLLCAFAIFVLIVIIKRRNDWKKVYV